MEEDFNNELSFSDSDTTRTTPGPIRNARTHSYEAPHPYGRPTGVMSFGPHPNVLNDSADRMSNTPPVSSQQQFHNQAHPGTPYDYPRHLQPIQNTTGSFFAEDRVIRTTESTPLPASAVDALSSKLGLSTTDQKKMHAFNKSDARTRELSIYGELLHSACLIARTVARAEDIAKDQAEVKKSIKSNWEISENALVIRNVMKHLMARTPDAYPKIDEMAENYLFPPKLDDDIKRERLESLNMLGYYSDPKIKKEIIAHINKELHSHRNQFRDKIFDFAKDRVPLEDFATSMLTSWNTTKKTYAVAPQEVLARYAFLRKHGATGKAQYDERYAAAKAAGYNKPKVSTDFWLLVDRELNQLYEKFGPDTRGEKWISYAEEVIAQDRADYPRSAGAIFYDPPH